MVVIALDRYLLICHGYFTSWSKTAVLVLITWSISLVVPALMTLPESILLVNGIICNPNFISRDPLTAGLLQMGVALLCLAATILVFCYANVFFKYQYMLRRKEGGGEMSRNEETALSPKSKLLLKKLVLITANYLFTFSPYIVSFLIMIATKAEPDTTFETVVVTVFEIGMLLNPILIYILDAKMKRSVNQMLGLHREPSRTIHFEMKAPVAKANILQLRPSAPLTDTLNEVKTVLLPR